MVKAKPEESHEEGAREESGGGEGAGEGEGEEAAEPEAGPEPGAPFALPIALDGSTFEASYGDVREDRVVLYGTALPQVRDGATRPG